MITVSRYGTLWIRGFWVYLMLIVINVVVGLVGAGISRLLRFVISEPLLLGFSITVLTVGLPFSGWLFERFATRLPRLPRSSRAREPTV